MSFFSIIRNPIKFRLFLLTKLPSAYFSGVRVKDANEERAVVTVPYKWFSTNPFKSTYFACLSMAAEMSTGVLALANIYGRKPSVSMLVLKIEGNFYKKATGISTFTCSDGKAVQQAVQQAINTGEGTQVTMNAMGTNEKGEIIAEFNITWSFKAKSASR
ncbi:MAG: DUF4442 domain-containing protein [Ferruginibacter sp.]